MTFLKRGVLWGCLSLFCGVSFANPVSNSHVLIALGNDLKKAAFPEDLIASESILYSNDNTSVMRIRKEDVERISHLAHEKFNRCGGFIVLPDRQAAEKLWTEQPLAIAAQKSRVVDYTINKESVVTGLLQEVEESNIRQVIQKLSSYKNRYYKSDSGVESQEWLAGHWKNLAKNRSDIKVYQWKHQGWPQDTVVMEIKGKSSDKIVIGGHGDSISGWWRRERSHAPGADDNASGIATITEIIKVLIDSSYQPQNTLVFASYAAEEVGLLGSREMAQSFKEQGENVLGVLQLDMTNFNGSEWDIVLISDHTNESQNKFLGALIDTYLPNLKWGYDKCGYACSDHASWTSQGYPASMPFEAKKGQSNGHIHTPRDTLSRSNNRALHAQKFARLGVAFVVELDN